MSINELDNMGWSGEVAERKTRLERGTYRGVIYDHKLTQVGKNKTWALVALIKVLLPEENAGVQVEKTWYITSNTMPYLARDLQDLECPIDSRLKLSEELQKLPLTGKIIDFKYDIPKDKEYPEVTWIRLSINSANIPQGAGDGINMTMSKHVHRYSKADQPIGDSVAKGNAYRQESEDDIPF